MKHTKKLIATVLLLATTGYLQANNEGMVEADDAVTADVLDQDEGASVAISEEMMAELRTDCQEIAQSEGITEAEMAEFVDVCVQESIRIESEAEMSEAEATDELLSENEEIPPEVESGDESVAAVAD